MLVASLTGLSPQGCLVAQATDQFERVTCEALIRIGKLNASARTAMSVSIEQSGEQRATLRNRRTQVLDRDVLVLKNPEPIQASMNTGESGEPLFGDDL